MSGNMYDYVNADVLAMWVRMLRADVDGAIWLGDGDQDLLFCERCAHPSARVVASGGFAATVLELVEELGVRGVVATAKRSAGTALGRGDVFWPSIGDISALLLASSSFRDTLRDAVGAPWLTACEKDVGDIRASAVHLAGSLGRLRAVCTQADVEPLTVQHVVERMLDPSTLKPCWEPIAAALTHLGIATEDVDRVRAVHGTRDFREELGECDGVEAAEVLAAATRLLRPRGLRPRSELTSEGLLRLLRTAFDLEELVADEMYWRMKTWERRNRSFPLLRHWRALDPLGVVLDQRYWRANLESMLRFCRAEDTIAAFEMDLDNFKQVNEQLDHSAGDEAIRTYCRIVSDVLGSVAEVYRRGGDEVVAFAPGVDRAKAELLAEELRARVERDFLTWAEERGLLTAPTASIGLAVFAGGESSDANTVIALMGRAQQQAKHTGKNKVVLLTQAGPPADG